MRYQPLTGKVHTAELYLGTPSFVRTEHIRKGAPARGLRYEAKVQKKLLKEHDNYIPGPWFRYTTTADNQRQNFAQPDGLFIDVENGIITINEIKLNHCVEAYFQLLDRYVPIVDAFFNRDEKLWSIATVETVYWYDCAVAFPTQIVRRRNIKSVVPGEFAVHICRP